MKKIKFLNLCLIACLSVMYSCNNAPPGTDTPKQSVQAPLEVDKKFVASFEPPYKVGMKYTYNVSSSQTPNLAPEVVSTEILEINAEKVKIKTTSSLKGEQTQEDKIDNFDPGMPNTGIINEGNESVTVPAGTYDAVKVSYFMDLGPNKAKTTIWLVKDIGAIKRVDILPDASIITTELKEFKN